MKNVFWHKAIAVACTCISTLTWGVEVESFSKTGQLTFTTLPTSAVYSVEWAPTLSGPWSSTWEGNRRIPVNGESVLHVEVPMVYRVRADTEPEQPTRVTLLGDSLTAQNAGTTFYSSIGYFTWAKGFCRYPMVLAANKGVNGARTSHMLDIIGEVIETEPDLVILCGGRNDISHGVGYSYSTNYLSAIIGILRDADIQVLVMNVTPRAIEESASAQQHRRQLNDWIGTLPDRYPGIRVVDIESGLLDYDTTTLRPYMAHDGGTHWSAVAAARIGRIVASVLEEMIRNVSRVWHGPDSSANVLTNPGFLNDGEGWSYPWEITGGIHYAPSYEHEGNMAVLSVTSGVRSVIYTIEHIDAGRFSSGDEIVLQVDIEWDIKEVVTGDQSFMPFGWLRAMNADHSFDEQPAIMHAATHQKVPIPEALRSGRGVWKTMPYTIGDNVNRLYVYAGFEGIERGRVIIHRVALYKTDGD
jgi:lysophospholipase L1-like esterase